jgi:hypothetical protein
VEPNSSGVVGMPVYLEIDGTDWSGHRSANVELRAQAEHAVEWGDGGDAEEFGHRTGGPYPDGDADDHRARVVDGAVAAARGRLAALPGDPLVTRAELEVRIREVQALRARSAARDGAATPVLVQRGAVGYVERIWPTQRSDG